MFRTVIHNWGISERLIHSFGHLKAALSMSIVLKIGQVNITKLAAVAMKKLTISPSQRQKKSKYEASVNTPSIFNLKKNTQTYEATQS